MATMGFLEFALFWNTYYEEFLRGYFRTENIMERTEWTGSL